MNLLDALPNLMSRLTGNSAAPTVTLTFTPQLPPEVRTQIATQNPAQPFTLTVSGSSGNQVTFIASNGQTYQAQVTPQLPLGTQLQLTTAELLPNQTVPQLQARILPQPAPLTGSGTNAPTGTTAPIVVQPTPTPSPQQPTTPTLPVLTFTAEATTPQALHTAISNALSQTLANTATPTAPTTNTPSAPLPIPAGPIAAKLPATFPQNLVAQPLILTPTAPMKPDGTQQATLQPAQVTPQQGQPRPMPQTVTLNIGVELKPHQPQPAIVLPAAPQTTATPQPPSNTSQPILFLTGHSQATPSLPTAPVTLATPAAPVPTAPEPPADLPPPTPVAARILPAQPQQPAGTQTALLATGTTVTLASSHPLPTGSLVIMTDIPINPTAAVQRVLSSEGQTQQQPNTHLQGNQTPATAAPVATQTKMAVLASGMVVQGTITGQTEQGQPLLTITAPPQMQGEQAILNLTNPTALMPLGAGLTIRVDNSLAATILGFTLPAQTQAAYTVGTIGARWENLQQGLQALQQQAPIQAANLRASLPQLSNLLPGLLAFTNALRTSDPEKVFDREASRILKSMGIDLSSDISQLSQLQQRPSPQAENQWRGTLFPYVEAPGEDPRQGGFFWRREKKDNPRASTSTRFVVEVDMSQIGALQLDGLVTYPDIWLKLRRTTPPEEGFTENLQSLVTQMLQAYGLKGGIAVETTAQFPVNPRAEMLAETDNPLPTSA